MEDMKVKKIFIESRFNEKLETHIKWSGDEGSHKTVVFVSGFGMDLHEWANSFDEIAKKLVESGYLTIQFSFSGLGKSEGNYRSTSISKQSQELRDVIRFARKFKQGDPNKVGIIAQSLGASVTVQSLPLQVNSIIFISGSLNPLGSLKRVFHEERGVNINPKGVTRLPRSGGKVTEIGYQFWDDLQKINLTKKLKESQFPIFVIHGSLDTKVLDEEAKEIIESHSGMSKLKIFSKGDHGIEEVSPEVRRQFLEDIIDWFEDTL